MENKNQDDIGWIEKVKIRQVVREDLPALEWEGEYRHFRRVYLDAFERSCCGKSVLWVADSPDFGLIGQAFVQLESDRKELADARVRAYVYGFRVRTQFQNYGIGSMILSTLEYDLIYRGFKFLTLNVAKDNDLARKFYRRHDFSITAHEPGEWSFEDENGIRCYVVESAWRMEKRLQRYSEEPEIFPCQNTILRL